MNLKYILTFVAVGFLTACSNSNSGSNPYADYIGLWEEQKDSTRFRTVMEITRDGETYLVNPNILKEQNLIALNKADGILSISMIGNAQLGLSEDKSTLRITKYSYVRISSERLNQIKVEIEKERLERETQAKNKLLEWEALQEKKRLEIVAQAEIRRLEKETFSKQCTDLVVEYKEKMHPFAVAFKNSLDAKEKQKIMARSRTINDTYIAKKESIPNPNGKYYCNGISGSYTIFSFL